MQKAVRPPCSTTGPSLCPVCFFLLPPTGADASRALNSSPPLPRGAQAGTPTLAHACSEQVTQLQPSRPHPGSRLERWRRRCHLLKRLLQTSHRPPLSHIGHTKPQRSLGNVPLSWAAKCPTKKHSGKRGDWIWEVTGDLSPSPAGAKDARLSSSDLPRALWWPFTAFVTTPPEVGAVPAPVSQIWEPLKLRGAESGSKSRVEEGADLGCSDFGSHTLNLWVASASSGPRGPRRAGSLSLCTRA